MAGGGVITPAGRHNAAAYADDKALITNEPSNMDYLLNKVLVPFCEFTSAAINIEKTEISGIDYATGASLPTDTIRYNGHPIPHLPANKPFKYLGVGLSLDLNFDGAVMSVLDRTKDAVEWLRMGAAFTH